jgi:hypothetical protein
MFVGKGKSLLKWGPRIATKFKGYVVGTQGCSCADYGHKSPTRIGTINGPSDTIDDVAATFGNWSAKWIGQTHLK